MLQRCHFVWGDFADDAHTEAGTWKWLTPHDVVAESDLYANFTNFIFEQCTQRLAQFERHVFGKSTNIVMALNNCGSAIMATTFNNVGIQSSLH